MQISTEAIVCAVLGHGENGAVVRLLTASDGLVAGYVRGGRSRRLRPVLQPGNVVQAELKARVEGQLAGATVELVRSRAPLGIDRLSAAAIVWLTSLTAAVLPEGQAHPKLHAALAAILDVMDHSDDARSWCAGIARYELLLLAELGFGLDLDSCAATGEVNDLVYVSPKSAQAVSRTAGLPWAERLLPLPTFLRDSSNADWPDIADALRMTGHFVGRHLIEVPRRDPLLDARQRLLRALPG